MWISGTKREAFKKTQKTTNYKLHDMKKGKGRNFRDEERKLSFAGHFLRFFLLLFITVKQD